MNVTQSRHPDARFLQQFERAASDNGFSSTRYLDLKPDLHSIVCERISGHPEAPRCYVSAGIHGDEPAGCAAMLELLRTDSLPDWMDWTLFPCLNPWGLRHNRRENALGVDLNRDYFTRSTAEVQAHIEYLQHCCTDKPFDLYISLHEDWEAKGFYLYEIMTLPVPRLAPDILAAVAKEIPLDTGPVVDDHLLDAPGYIHHRTEPDLPKGWPEAIFHCRLHTAYSYTFETPSSLPLAQRVNAQMTAFKSLLQAFRDVSGGVLLPR